MQTPIGYELTLAFICFLETIALEIITSNCFERTWSEIKPGRYHRHIKNNSENTFRGSAYKRWGWSNDSENFLKVDVKFV